MFVDMSLGSKFSSNSSFIAPTTQGQELLLYQNFLTQEVVNKQ